MEYSGILGYGILEFILGYELKLILEYGIYWTVHFGIWDIAYPPNQASLIGRCLNRLNRMFIWSRKERPEQNCDRNRISFCRLR